ncbi:hypothetical protein BXZ70DRAFT_131010 [Cristinia sonorae]|uniref:Uncharacterized protein n=1 Tax=Cristinia sonorae TaxID=1940300 RepID=A0A8K0UPY8_9AGAR|nr:hypothetical protein BXZ70DRAFT_131010 [Cristinia sonorae]
MASKSVTLDNSRITFQGGWEPVDNGETGNKGRATSGTGSFELSLSFTAQDVNASVGSAFNVSVCGTAFPVVADKITMNLLLDGAPFAFLGENGISGCFLNSPLATSPLSHTLFATVNVSDSYQSFTLDRVALSPLDAANDTRTDTDSHISTSTTIIPKTSTPDTNETTNIAAPSSSTEATSSSDSGNPRIATPPSSKTSQTSLSSTVKNTTAASPASSASLTLVNPHVSTGAIVGSVLGALLLILLGFVVWKWRSKRRAHHVAPSTEYLKSVPKMSSPYSEAKAIEFENQPYRKIHGLRLLSPSHASRDTEITLCEANSSPETPLLEDGVAEGGSDIANEASRRKDLLRALEAAFHGDPASTLVPHAIYEGHATGTATPPGVLRSRDDHEMISLSPSSHSSHSAASHGSGFIVE